MARIGRKVKVILFFLLCYLVYKHMAKKRTEWEAEEHRRQNEFQNYLQKLEEMARPVKNDQRQHNYCRYITEFVSHFSQERCIVVGSTTEGTRLRSNKDEGDFDYLIISGIEIPVDALEYRTDVPCFVHIKSKTITELFPNTEFIDGEYLPSRLLKSVSKEAFKLMNGIRDIVLLPNVFRGGYHNNYQFSEDCKPGAKLEHYAVPQQNEYIMPNNSTEPDLEATKEQFHSALTSYGVSKNTLSLFKNIFKLLEDVKGDESSKALIYQTFGGLIGAISQSTNTEQKLESLNDNEDQMKSKSQHTEKNKNQETRHSQDDLVSLQYSYKSSKDFIAAFPLKGRIPCLDEWRNRKGRLWPAQEIVDKIYDSQVFVVAKPAIVNPDTPKDFCLGFNSAEMILASNECMTKEQKLCFLVLKAFQKGVLKEYADILTNFHWKTVFYWTSERLGQSIFKKESMLVALNIVLENMIQCLQNLRLRHYFIDSNLIAHLTYEKAQEIIMKIRSIADNPIEALNSFFTQDEIKESVTVEIPKSEVDKLRIHDKDSSSKDQAMAIASVMSQMQEGTQGDDSKLIEALYDTLKLVVQDELDGKGEGLLKYDNDGPSINDLIKHGMKYSSTKFSDPQEKKKALDELRKAAISAGFNMLFKKKK